MKNKILAIFFIMGIIFLSGCSGSTEVVNVEGNQATSFSVDTFFNKFYESFGTRLSKENTVDEGNFIVYENEGVDIVEIKDQNNFVLNQEELFDFVKTLDNYEENKIQDIIKESRNLRENVYEFYPNKKGLGYSEDLGVEKTWSVLFFAPSSKDQVLTTYIEKWFYFYCAPNLIVKVEAKADKSYTQFKATGDSNDVLKTISNELETYENGINGNNYESNYDDIRTICPSLPKDF